MKSLTLDHCDQRNRQIRTYGLVPTFITILVIQAGYPCEYLKRLLQVRGKLLYILLKLLKKGLKNL